MSRITLAGKDNRFLFWCPACETGHQITTPPWTFDGNLESPTVEASILVGGVQWAEGEPFHDKHHAKVAAGEPTVCHSFLRAGRWEFLSDCTHDLAGQTVDVVPFPGPSV